MKTLQTFASVHGTVHNPSTRSATSSAVKPTRRDAQPPWLSGAQSRAKPKSSLGELRLAEDKLALD